MECELWYEEFDADIRTPRSIHPWGHSFWDSWIMRIWNNAIIKCPVWRWVQPVEFGRRLPQINHALMKLIQIEQIRKRKKNVVSKLKLGDLSRDNDHEWFDDIEEKLDFQEVPELFLQKVTSSEIIYKQKPGAKIKNIENNNIQHNLNDSIAIKLKETAKPVDIDNEILLKNNEEEKKQIIENPNLLIKKDAFQVEQNKNKANPSSKKYSFRKDSFLCRYIVTHKNSWLLWMLRKFTGCKHSYSWAENFIWNTLNTVMLYCVSRPFLIKIVEPMKEHFEAYDISWKKFLIIESAVWLGLSVFQSRKWIKNYFQFNIQ